MYYVDTPPPTLIQSETSSKSSFQDSAAGVEPHYVRIVADASVAYAPVVARSRTSLVNGMTSFRAPALSVVQRSPLWPATFCNSTQIQYLRVQPGLLNGTALRHVVPVRVSRSVRCTCCDITLNSPQQAQQHYGGKAHQRRLQKLQQPRPPDTEIETESRDGELERDADDVTREQLDADADSITTMQDGEVSERCQRDNQTTKRDADAANSGGKKRPSGDIRRHPNKCLRGDVSASDDAPAADDNDDNWTASGDVSDRSDVDSSAADADDARPEITGNLPRDVIDVGESAQPTPEMDPLLAEVLLYADSPTTDDVVTTSMERPLPVTSSTSYSERLSGGRCSDVASTANTCCYDKAADDVTLTSLHPLPAASMTTKGACSGTTTFASSGTPYVGAVCLLPGASPMPTRVGCVLHSAARLFPFPVPTRISQRAPFIVGGSPVTLSPPTMPLGTARWLPLPHAAPSPPGPSLSLDSPAVIPADYFRKQHVTGCTGLGSPQIGYYVATPGNSRCPSDFRVCGTFQTNSSEVSNTSRPPHPPIQSSSVGPPRRTSPTQVPADSNSAASSDDVIAKLDPVSRAVYDNFLGRLRTTAKPKTGTGTGRRRGHMTDVTRSYRN